MKNKKILIIRKFNEKGAEILKSAGFSVTTWNEDRPRTQEKLNEGSKINDALLRTVTDGINNKFLNECSHLDVISEKESGYENTDITEATRLGMQVGFTPEAMSEVTADIAFGMMIAV